MFQGNLLSAEFCFAEHLTLPRLQQYLRGSEKIRSAPVKTLPRLNCADGFSISVQASDFHACSPRSLTGPYSHVECALPSQEVATLAPFILDEPGVSPLESVYRNVPVLVVIELINEHGGLAL